MDLFRFTAGTTPLLLSMPHGGTYLPPEIAAKLAPEGRKLADTDWHVERLYDFAAGLGASLLAATHSRYVIDLNRSPDGMPLYPGADNSELCPLTSFDGKPLYLPGEEPDQEAMAGRRETYWEPYHDQLQLAIQDLRAKHGLVVVWEAHSIRSRLPRFFAGRLPDFNLGTSGGATCAPELLANLRQGLEPAAAQGFTHAVDGRFTGGFITRHYGAPASGIHTVQLELAQATYMEEEPPYAFREDLAQRLRPLLADLLQRALDWSRSNLRGFVRS